MRLTGHRFDQQVFGKTADEIEAKAKEAVLAYYSDCAGVEWSVDTTAMVDMAGRVISYAGNVTATRQ